MDTKKKKIYITGVSGFIGSRLAKIFLNQGYQVIGITRKLASVVSNELGIDVIEADFNDTSHLELEAANLIIHCATANDILSKDIGAGLSLSIVGTNKLLEASKKAGIQNVIFFSTAQVYGTELNGYYDELTKINCETPYAANHYLGEELCKFYCNTQNFNITVLRPSNVYGVPEISTVNRKTLVPMCFVNDAINYGSIGLRSSGKQKRNFILIDQLAEIIFKTIENFPKGYSIRNCGSNLVLSILDVVNIISDKYQSHYNKKLDTLVESNKPENSNNFEYKSKFIDYSNSKKDCTDYMENVIDKLFQVGIKN
tara:strand:- start:392 stop:1330 length:939 start_codon:yes stop_codon:yes gene_type:complete